METERLEGNAEDFKGTVSDLLLKGGNFVDMSTSLYPDFYNDKKLKNAIKACVQKVLRFRILLDEVTDIEELKKEVSWIFELKNKYPDALEIAKATEDIPHHILIDEKYFRIEAKHKHDKTVGLKVKNVIITNPPRIIAMQLIRQFDSWWEKSEAVQ